MTKKTILHKQMRISKSNWRVARKTAKHSLLLDDSPNARTNRIPEKSELNNYYFKGNQITTEAERLEALEYLESIAKTQSDHAEFDNIKFNRTKSKFKKWLTNPKTSESEKLIFSSLLEKSDSHKPVNTEQVISDFSDISEKITRRNDKLKAIETFAELQNEKVNINYDNSGGMSIRLTEVILKIPDHNNINICGDEAGEILTSYYKKNFPQFDIPVIAIHKDEAGEEHPHIFIDCKNKNTGQYDFPQQQYEYIKNKKKLDDFPDKYSKCSDEQVKLIGEELQSDFYKHLNVCCIKNQKLYSFAKLDLTDEEKEERKKEFAMNKKPIADREYNTGNKLKEDNKKLEAKNDNIKKNLEKFVKNIISKAAKYIQALYKSESDAKLKQQAEKLAVDYSDANKAIIDPIIEPVLEAEKENNKDHLKKAIAQKSKNRPRPKNLR